MIVDLPEPLGPMKPYRLPKFKEKSVFSMRLAPWKAMVTSRTWMSLDYAGFKRYGGI